MVPAFTIISSQKSKELSKAITGMFKSEFLQGFANFCVR